jgi:predicted nucleic acid-binding protein
MTDSSIVLPTNPERGRFLDSNVWLYAISQRTEDPAHERKHSIAVSMTQGENLITSFQVINEVCVNAIRKLSFNEEEINALIISFYDSCFVIEQSRNLLTEASQLRIRYRFSFWDSLIVASALQSKASILYSEDMQGGLKVSSELEIVNPFR